jgi:hypothetical protein
VNYINLFFPLPSINYYSFKSRINQNSPSTLILNQTQTASDKSPQSSTNNVQVSDIDFLDDSFDFEIASLQNPEIENRSNNIGNETFVEFRYCSNILIAEFIFLVVFIFSLL